MDGRKGAEQAQGPTGTHRNQNTSSLPYCPYLDSNLEIQDKGSGLGEFENHWAKTSYLSDYSYISIYTNIIHME